MPDVNELPTRMLQDVERYVGYVACIMLLTSWAIRQLNSGHEATLIPIKKQNLTQGVRKNPYLVYPPPMGTPPGNFLLPLLGATRGAKCPT